MDSDHQARISERAYAIWQAEGQPAGRDEDHWRRAAREIEEEEKIGAGVAPPAPILRSHRVKPQADGEKGGSASKGPPAQGRGSERRRRERPGVDAEASS